MIRDSRRDPRLEKRGSHFYFSNETEKIFVYSATPSVNPEPKYHPIFLVFPQQIDDACSLRSAIISSNNKNNHNPQPRKWDLKVFLQQWNHCWTKEIRKILVSLAPKKTLELSNEIVFNLPAKMTVILVPYKVYQSLKW